MLNQAPPSSVLSKSDQLRAPIWLPASGSAHIFGDLLQVSFRLWWGFRKVTVSLDGVFSLTPAPQIRGLPLWRLGGGELGAVLRPRRSVDAERPVGGHAGSRGDGAPEARADRLLPAVGGQRPAGRQRGSGPVDGHGSVATPPPRHTPPSSTQTC